MDTSPESLLDQVSNQKTFIVFVQALANERHRAAEIEASDPTAYAIDGALNWKNIDISSYLHAALDYFEEKPLHKPELLPSWRMFAEVLYCGKIIE